MRESLTALRDYHYLVSCKNCSNNPRNSSGGPSSAAQGTGASLAAEPEATKQPSLERVVCGSARSAQSRRLPYVQPQSADELTFELVVGKRLLVELRAI
jgi:hypothetical protein